MYKRIAVLFDNSLESNRALASAIAIAKMFDSELGIMMMRELVPIYTAYAQSVIPEANEILASDRETIYCALQDGAREKALAVGLAPTFHLFAPKEHAEVIELLKLHGANLLILGLRHKGSLISRLCYARRDAGAVSSCPPSTCDASAHGGHSVAADPLECAHARRQASSIRAEFAGVSQSHTVPSTVE